jgi:hypothetical protein
MFVIIQKVIAVATRDATSEQDNYRHDAAIPFSYNSRRATTPCLMARSLGTVRDSRLARLSSVAIRHDSVCLTTTVKPHAIGLGSPVARPPGWLGCGEEE